MSYKARAGTAHAVILDCGANMRQFRGASTAFTLAKGCLNRFLERKLFQESKDELCIIAMGSPDTHNPLYDDRVPFQHISVLNEFATVNWDLMSRVETTMVQSDYSADWVDAVIVALDQLHNYCDEKKAGRGWSVVLMSNLAGPLHCEEHLDAVTAQLKEKNVDFRVIGIDDEEEDGPSGGPSDTPQKKTKSQERSEELIRTVCSSTGSTTYAFEEAAQHLESWDVKTISATPWKVDLELADVRIPVCMYVRTKKPALKTWKNKYAGAEETGAGPTQQIANVVGHYTKDDASEVDKEDMGVAYRYGPDLIPFSADDVAFIKLAEPKSLKVVAFIPLEDLPPSHRIGETVHLVTANPTDNNAAQALLALLAACDEGWEGQRRAILVRRVYSRATAPKLGALIPANMEDGEQFFYYVEVPFAEDARTFEFDSLPTEMKPHESEAVNDFIEAAMLVQDGEELLVPDEQTDPYIQRLYHCMRLRALEDNCVLPLEETCPSFNLAAGDDRQTPKDPTDTAATLAALFPTRYRERTQVATGQQIFAVSDEAPADDLDYDDGFPNSLSTVAEVSTLTDRFGLARTGRLVCEKVQLLIMTSFGDQLFASAVEYLREFRTRAISLNTSSLYNDCLKTLSELLPSSKASLWQLLSSSALLLISSQELPSSSLSFSEAAEFTARFSTCKAPCRVEVPEDEDDLDL